jgi:predicted DNA-binding protein with PD1-like motif
MKLLAIRLKPGEDLKQELRNFVLIHQIQAGFILTAIGSLQQATIRFANQQTSSVLTDKFEILSLNGTLSIGGIHLHVALGDRSGNVIGGHLNDGCIIYTTAEIVMGEIPNQVFLRTPDQQTGFLELEIKEQSYLDS